MVGKRHENKDTEKKGWVLYHGEVAVKEEKFSHIWKPPHRWGQGGALEPQRGVQQQIEDKAERIWPTGISQQRSCLDTYHRESGLGAEPSPQGED